MKKFIEENIIYILLIGISVIVICISAIGRYTIRDIVFSIGCSTLAAGLMAVLVNRYASRLEEKRITSEKKVYFQDINSEFINLIGHMIWLGERVDDNEFNWDLPDETYFTLPFMISAGNKYSSKTIEYSEAMKILEEQSKMFLPEDMSALSEETIKRQRKMVNILTVKSERLLSLIVNLTNNKLTLSSLKMMELEQVNNIARKVNSVFQALDLKRPNYSTVVQLILDTYEIIRKNCGYTDKISVGPNGLIQ